jgi:SAM-dependent methyltransferase
MGQLPRHVTINRDIWNRSAPDWVAAGERLWGSEPQWGIWGIPEAALGLLPADMAGMAAIELGCGTGYGAAWMARRGARVTGVDIAVEQLATARRLGRQHGLDVTWLEASAESVPCPDASFDFTLSEYGAAIWCDPHRWIPEARRLLRPGGRLVFLGHSPWAAVCAPTDGSGPVSRQLQRPYFSLHCLDWSQAPVDPGGVEFALPVSTWFALFRRHGLVVEDFMELAAPAEAADCRFGVTPEWARDFPAEQVWRLRVPG